MMRATYLYHSGTDLDVVNAARVSFAKESQWEHTEWTNVDEEGHKTVVKGGRCLGHRDAKLIKYLAAHNHWTPFSHTSITMREDVPVFVARQRFKHVVGFTYNEVSRRYVDETPSFYNPKTWRSRPEGSVKQGSGEDIDEKTGRELCTSYVNAIQTCREVYRDLLAKGVAPEQARAVLPQSMMTSYYVTGSLPAWARAYKLRIEESAQQEIQELAEQWYHIISPLFPASWEALTRK